MPYKPFSQYKQWAEQIAQMQADLDVGKTTLQTAVTRAEALADLSDNTGAIVDTIGAEDMLTGMANSAGAVANGSAGVAKAAAVGTGGHVQTAAEAWGDLAMHPVRNATDFWSWLDLDLGSWFDGMNDWLHHLTWATPLASLTHFLSGGLLTWLTAAFLGFRIFSMARGIATPGRRGPVKLVYYQVPTKAAESVTSYLKGAHQIEVRDVQKTNETHSLIGIPIYHSGKSSRALSILSKQTGLEYTKL